MASLWPLLLLGLVAGERHYLFTAPKAFNAGESEKMCLTLFDVPETGYLTLTLKNYGGRKIGRHSQAVTGVAGGSQQTCFDVKIPDARQWRAKLKLAVTFPAEANYSISGERSVEIKNRVPNAPEEYLFVQTDKYVYKPGQLVQFRVFSVNSNLRPISRPIPLIYVETPLGTRVAQWTNETGQNGLVQLNLQLSEEPTLGEWNINVKTSSGKTQKKVFEVEEYVLPKFEVDVKGPPYILADAKEVIFRVCGTYTYGKLVSGNATVHITAQRKRGVWGRGPPTTITRHQHTSGADCAGYRLDAVTLGLDYDQDDLTGIEVRAELTEQGTDVTFEDTKRFQVEYTKLKLATEDQRDKYFKPGLPFIDRIKVLHPDDSPAPGERVQLCLKHCRAPEDRNCQHVTSDSNGIVTFYVPPREQNVQTIDIEATHPLAVSSRHRRMKADKLSYQIKGWHSNSGAFLQLSRKDGIQFSCGTNADIAVLFTARLGSRLELFYQVMARGDIQPSVSVPVTFDEPADLSAAGLDRATAIGSPSAEASPTGVVTLSIPVTSSMSTGFKVLVYMVVEGEVIADSQKYEAAPCLENPVSLRWSPDRARPKEEVQLTVQAAPGSLCGLDAVDKSVHLLGKKNKISLSEFFDRLKKLNLDQSSGFTQLDDDKYCNDKYGSPRHSFESPPPAGNRKKRAIYETSYYYSYYWTSTHVDSLTAFDARSVLVLSDLDTETRRCVGQRRRERRRWYDRPPYYLPGFHYNPWAQSLGPGPYADRFSMTQRRTGSPRFRGPSGFRGSSGIRGPSRIHGLAGIPGPAGMPGPPGGGPDPPVVPEPAAPSPVPDTVRTYFPETWLFDLHTIGEDGTVTLSQEVPDTITEWVGGAVCTSDTAGLGIASPASLTSFQPFFVTYTLPYSVKRGETLVLKVSVRNYNQHDLPIKLTLAASDQFDTLTPPVVTSCVPAGATEVVPYRLHPTALGDVNITAVAEVYPDYPSACGPQTILHFSDAVTRPVLVEPEGFEQEIINSSFICNTPGRSELSGDGTDLDVTWPLVLPADLVPGSERAHVAVVGDLLGPSIDNLESLVRQPTGCGEQNMVLFAPNIHVMKYLTAVGELTETIIEKLVRHMKSGYQRELTYRHDDKSYSAFGNSDSSGSMWLTAFVVKSFGDAKKFIFIDEDDLSASVGWIESRQTEDGCFSSVGKVLNKAMKGGVSSSGQQALTAFVTIALLQSGVQLRDNTLQHAFRCLQQDSTPDVYTLTLRTYARALAGHTAEARAGLAELKRRATREEGHMYWQNSATEENKALSVEMGAYNILTMDVLWRAGDRQHFSDALSAVRWINAQRNSRGGFVSTQDTVLALEALAVFSASLPRSSQANLRLHLSDGYGLDDVISVTHANRLLLQTRDVTHLPGQVRVQAEGTGCALVQAILKYNIQSASPSEALSISVKSRPKPAQSKCLKHTTEICVSYQKAGETDMAVVEVEMVSGFVPNKGSLETLKQDAELDLKRWEVSKNKAVFYFDSLDSRQRCFEMVVQREQEVEDAKPAVATVYDYYQKEVTMSTSYTVDVDCETMPDWQPPLPGK